MSDTEQKIIIAVDGFSSCGKSTFAKAIARRLGYIFIDTGAMYRAVTLYALEHGAIRSGMVDEEAVVGLLDRISITFRFNPDRGASDIYVNGDLVEGKIRTIEVSNCVSHVSAIPAVRHKLVAMQQEMGRRKGVVMDGRDIGTVVFPHAEMKLFMTADPHVRALRRYEELRAKGDNVTLEEIEQNVRSRDKADMSRAVSPLRQAEDAIVLDNSHMTVDEQMDWFMEQLRQLRERMRAQEGRQTEQQQ
ncbi:cytidylate kinase [Alistipes sp. An31A]|jgi:cytidylate kinase|uniref:(d)CMP kinase n=1 Tax=Alistipes sp. An31A TaxID=1965631 RepID=UPI000B3809E2|nr:(d)CMP kinase [Alistipes sp. An31A]OUO20695.1 cytidylate kinase [Alistipes sp. An31A]